VFLRRVGKSGNFLRARTVCESVNVKESSSFASEQVCGFFLTQLLVKFSAVQKIEDTIFDGFKTDLMFVLLDISRCCERHCVIMHVHC
jgi:hypothetical protein